MACRHWLSYSHSDQALFRRPDLENTWDALVVPGTLATFYFEGTGGFVLAQRAPYVIDPRTPLLQESTEIKRAIPRASHLKLLEVHDPSPLDWWPDREIPLAHWQDGRWPEVVDRVLEFQQRYATSATARLGKYERLKAKARNESPPASRETDAPTRFVPPYWAVRGTTDPWWALSKQAIEIAVSRFGPSTQPILAITDGAPIGVLADLIADLPTGLEHVFCWKGSWNEMEAKADDVGEWADVIAVAAQRGITVMNLYGGFLSALMLSLGLAGFGHGVGYSENRDVRRLGETGAPPVRYYVPAVHAFLPVPSAQPLIEHLPADWACRCAICEPAWQSAGHPDISKLTPEQRKAHFLLCRRAEIAAVEADPAGALRQVNEVAGWLDENPLTLIKTERLARALHTWHDAVKARQM